MEFWWNFKSGLSDCACKMPEFSEYGRVGSSEAVMMENKIFEDRRYRFIDAYVTHGLIRSL